MQEKHWIRFNIHLVSGYSWEGLGALVQVNAILAICDKPSADKMFSGEKLKAFPTRQGCSLLPLLFSIVLEVQTRAIRQGKKVKDIQIENEVKVSVFADDMILDIENPKHSSKKLLGTISKYSKVAGYMYKNPTAFLYANREISVIEFYSFVAIATK